MYKDGTQPKKKNQSLNGQLTQNGLSLTFLAIDLDCHGLNA